MSERLYIENFGPIKKMAFEFKKINILIGEQSTGKSTVVKLIAAINKMASGETLAGGASGMMRKNEFGKPEHFKRHLKIYEIDTYLDDSTSITYQHKLFSFEYVNNDCLIINEQTINDKDVFLGNLNATFIPADRIAINLLSNEVLFSLTGINQGLPGYFVRFGQLFSRLKKSKEIFDFADTLDVEYKYENELDKIRIAGNKQIGMTDASSAIQANIPLLVVLNHQSNEALQNYGPDFKITIIEEPELNCFPSLQNSIIKYIIKSIRSEQAKYNRRIFITTHSPYILTSLNNLMYAYQVGQEYKNEVNKIIEKNYWVNPDDVSAYRLMTDGTAKNIFDSELKQIDAGELDEISRSINEEWDKLSDIKFSAVNEH